MTLEAVNKNSSVALGALDFVVTAHNVEATIRPCLSALLGVDGARAVIVVNDSSTDGTAGIIGAIDDPRLRVMSVSFRSRARTSNAGFRASDAEFVCSVDADVIFGEGRFDRFLELLDDFPFLMLTDDPQDQVPRSIGWDPDFAPPRNAFLFSRRRLPNLAFSEIYPKTGAEDTDLAIRLLKAGVSLGAVYGGYQHEREEGSMGWRRRAHFHLWNLITYFRHLDVPMCRRRLASIARHPLRRAVRSIRQELGQL